MSLQWRSDVPQGGKTAVKHGSNVSALQGLWKMGHVRGSMPGPWHCSRMRLTAYTLLKYALAHPPGCARSAGLQWGDTGKAVGPA